MAGMQEHTRPHPNVRFGPSGGHGDATGNYRVTLEPPPSRPNPVLQAAQFLRERGETLDELTVARLAAYCDEQVSAAPL